MSPPNRPFRRSATATPGPEWREWLLMVAAGGLLIGWILLVWGILKLTGPIRCGDSTMPNDESYRCTLQGSYSSGDSYVEVQEEQLFVGQGLVGVGGLGIVAGGVSAIVLIATRKRL
jgi:hypothetical protein